VTLEIITFGCRLNACETEVIRACAGEAGLTDSIVFNTCAVTAEAVRQARQAIRRARGEHPEKRLVVTGCAAQTEPGTFAEMPEVDLVLGNAEKLTASAYRAVPDFGIGGMEKVRVNDIMSVRETTSHMPQGVDGWARAYMQVQNGCDHRCTFCIIPFGRGPSRSVPMGAVVEQVRRLVDRGYPEIVLTGVDITSYGDDLPGRPRLGSLVRNLLKHVQSLQRLRLSSIDCVEADPELRRAVAEEERFMPHLHLSLQAGDDLVLKRMKRRHSRDDAIRFCSEIRDVRPDVAFGADLIAGFPTETEAMFEKTLRLVGDCGLTHLHVFPFSPRSGTPAARMPQVPRQEVRLRASRLREAGERAFAARLAREVGARRSVLVEQPGFGRTEHFMPVNFHNGEPGEIVSVDIRSADGRTLRGEHFKEAA